MFQELVKSAKEGNIRSKEEIVSKLQPLLVSSIRSYYNIARDYDDSMQDGNLLILECIESYDEEKGVYFLAYVKSKITYLYLNKNKERIHLSLNEKLKDGENELIDLIESGEIDILDRIIKSQGNLHLYEAYEGLSKREKEVISLYYIRGDNMKEIAKKLGVSYRTVVNTKVNAILKLKTHLQVKNPLYL